MHKDISLVFFGSGPVAAKSLELLSANFAVEAVITKPRPAHHRGAVPVLDLYEQAHGSLGDLITVSSKAELSAIVSSNQFSSRLGVVIDFGIIISQDVIDSFPLGIINSHFSLLPEWRGADPITFSILSGQKQTGVSLMRITAGLDEGPLLAFGIYDIQGNETTPLLTDSLIALSDGLLVSELPRYVATQTVFSQQEASAAIGHVTEATYSRKLTKDDGILDFKKTAEVLAREVRAYSGWPASRTTLAGKDVVVTAAHVLSEAELSSIKAGQPGAVWQGHSKRFGVYSANGSVLVIDRLKPAGKQDMSAEAFLNGYGKDL